MSKTIILHGHAGGPNPWKVALMLEELKVPYEVKLWEFPDLKTEKYEKINLNGRTPTIEDPNTGITLWESGAILEYLVETYDKEGKFTYTDSPEKWQLKQWLHFQVSGQGPYYGQRAWFMHYHQEKIPSAQDRYGKEVKRIMSVIDNHLKKTGQEYIVGKKFTYADLALIPWGWLVPWMMPEGFEDEVKKDLPTYWSWWEKVSARSAVEKVKGDREKAMSGH